MRPAARNVNPVSQKLRTVHGAASATAGTMLRGDGLTGPPDCQQEQCVPMPDGRPVSTPQRGVSCGPRGLRAGRATVGIAERPGPLLSFTHGARMGRHLGNVRCIGSFLVGLGAAAIMLTFRPARLPAPVPQVQPST